MFHEKLGYFRLKLKTINYTGAFTSRQAYFCVHTSQFAIQDIKKTFIQGLMFNKTINFYFIKDILK